VLRCCAGALNTRGSAALRRPRSGPFSVNESNPAADKALVPGGLISAVAHDLDQLQFGLLLQYESSTKLSRSVPGTKSQPAVTFQSGWSLQTAPPHERVEIIPT
jgi:hypothetical protein